MRGEWHTLPGPTAFLDRLQTDLADGKSVLFEAPATLPISIDHCLHDRLERFAWTPLEAGDDSPMTCIRRALPDQGSTLLPAPGRLYDIPGFGGRILYLADVSPLRIPAWTDFLVEFAHASRQQGLLNRSAFLARMDGAGSVRFSEDLLLVRRSWEDVVDDTDALLLAHKAIRAFGSSPVLSSLKAALCAELAQWDLVLCDDLSRQSVSALLQPAAMLTSYAKSLGWETLGPSTPEHVLWYRGVLQTYCGRRRTHHAWHALRGRLEELQSAVWRAELKVLFPFAEEQCLRIIQRHGHHLRTPHTRKDGTVLNNVLEFELVDVCYQLQAGPRVPRTLREYAHKLWLMRNKLAHRTCLDAPMLTSAVLDFDVDTVV